MIEITVVTMPGNVRNLKVEAGSTINSILSANGYSVSGYSIRLNGEDSDVNAVVSEPNSRIVLTKQIKGNN